MSGACHKHNFDGASSRYKRVLGIVIAINAVMFVVEMSYGIVGESQALKADALDFLSDSLTYAMSLWAIGRSVEVRSNVALIKGVSLFVLAIWILVSTFYYALVTNNPSSPIMSGVALAALAANSLSVLLLMRYRDGDANVRSVWLCSRNDAIGNVAVLFAAGAVFLTRTHWPDLIIALVLAGLFSSSSIQIIRQALNERKGIAVEHSGGH